MWKLVLLSLVACTFAAPTVDLALLKSLKTKTRVNILVSFKGSTDAALDQLRALRFTSRNERLTTVANTLEAHSKAIQADVVSFLRQQPWIHYDVLWITNQIAITGADGPLVGQLSNFEEVTEITEEFFIPLDEPLDYEEDNNGPSPRAEWGVDNVQAPQVWNQGNNGKGIVVATIDTGVRHTHESLRDNFFGNYGWYDPGSKSKTPSDSQGHGTHCTGSISGTKNIGVAPGSKWQACRGCSSSSCSNTHLLACGQWTACPTDTSGNNKDCTKAPHVVSNSWGGGRGNKFYEKVIEAWHAAGIIPVFANGNSGPSCNTANSPADGNVIAIGSITNANKVSSFSSVGPSAYKAIKPDYAAPGSNIRSAAKSSDTAYTTMSGTSMACPHAAGVVALLLAENSNLTYNQVRDHLKAGAQSTSPTNKSCGNIADNVYPNNHVGHGRLNALKSVQSVQSGSS